MPTRRDRCQPDRRRHHGDGLPSRRSPTRRRRQAGGVSTWQLVARRRRADSHTRRRIRAFAGAGRRCSRLRSGTRASGSGIRAARCASSTPPPARPFVESGAGARAQRIGFAPKADGLVAVDSAGRLLRWDVDCPHPEVSLRALFGKVWYEGYDRPGFVWQSTGGTDDFEPKLSLTPLLFGTLKGTFYALLFAVPLALLGAMYTSQFMHPRLKAIVKPTVEIMAALPSVVLGFLAGLWLAPHRARDPGSVHFADRHRRASCSSRSSRGVRCRAAGARACGRAPSCCCVIPVVARRARPLRSASADGSRSTVLGGDFRAWLLSVLGSPYDQRNAIVVGFAMGFAVIPIIFTIAEDAFSNVPPHLTAGSLALGANRWQTAMRVVLPTASPGIFSAIMVGFGRAVGETMIVLMATGNTPIMSWSPFNGFRALSANIAVELPEAPSGGTLFRALFLAALLLFVLTFVVNTAAELVRQRLRQKYRTL